MNTFKVNGARMSLCHMRDELGCLNQYGLLDERLEDELNKPLGEWQNFALVTHLKRFIALSIDWY